MSAQSARVAVVQAPSALFDTPTTLRRVADLTAEAAGQGARLVLFPEAFVGGYPRGLGFATVVGSRGPNARDLYLRYLNAAVTLPGPQADQLGDIARRHGIHLAIGVIERDADHSRATVYCTLAYFGPDGALLGKHRKIKPTAAERYIWGEGDGSTMPVIHTPFGRVAGLICWENLMPLARAAVYAQGVDIYLAPTADYRDPWQAALRCIAYEARCYVLGCNQFVTPADYPPDCRAGDDGRPLPDVICRGGSAIYSPMADVLAGPLYDKPGILYADVDADEAAKARFDLDVTGHYTRSDVFELIVHDQPRPPLRRCGDAR